MLNYIFAVLLTIIIELPIYIFLRYKGKLFYSLFILINIITNLSLNILLYLIFYISYNLCSYSLSHYVFYIIAVFLEIAVVIIEYLVLAEINGKNKKLLFAVILANVLSCSIGLVIMPLINEGMKILVI